LGQDLRQGREEKNYGHESRRKKADGQKAGDLEKERQPLGWPGARLAARWIPSRANCPPEIHAARGPQPIKDEKRQSLRSADMADEQLGGQEYEEITSDEVDRVVEQLERLMETVQSENIKSYIEDAINSIFFLVYEEDDSAEAA
jgi:hypothetical protein